MRTSAFNSVSGRASATSTTAAMTGVPCRPHSRPRTRGSGRAPDDAAACSSSSTPGMRQKGGAARPSHRTCRRRELHASAAMHCDKPLAHPAMRSTLPNTGDIAWAMAVNDPGSQSSGVGTAKRQAEGGARSSDLPGPQEKARKGAPDQVPHLQHIPTKRATHTRRRLRRPRRGYRLGSSAPDSLPRQRGPRPDRRGEI